MRCGVARYDDAWRADFPLARRTRRPSFSLVNARARIRMDFEDYLRWEAEQEEKHEHVDGEAVLRRAPRAGPVHGGSVLDSLALRASEEYARGVRRRDLCVGVPG